MARRTKFNAFRNDKLHVCARMCGTCIYRPGAVVDKAYVVNDALKAGTAVICHSTLDTEQNLVCAGFLEHDATPLLRYAEHLGIIVKVRRPAK